MTAPTLSFGLSFNDLYDREGLSRLDAAFAAWLKAANADVHARLMAARTAPESLAAKDESNLLIEVARPLEDFVGELFGISGDVARRILVTPIDDAGTRPPARWRLTFASGIARITSNGACSETWPRWASSACRSRRSTAARGWTTSPWASPARSWSTSTPRCA